MRDGRAGLRFNLLAGRHPGKIEAAAGWADVIAFGNPVGYGLWKSALSTPSRQAVQLALGSPRGRCEATFVLGRPAL